MTNAAEGTQHQDGLNRMRETYDKAVYEIKEKAINQKYRKYGVLFDRKEPWSKKKKVETLGLI